MSEPFDPYRKWLGIPPQDQPPHHYRLLGISPFEDDPDVVENAANRQMQHVRTYQQGRNAAHSQRILNELSAAKLTLLDENKKSAYDKQLRRELKLRKQAVTSEQPAAGNGAESAAAGSLPPVVPSASQGHPMGVPMGSEFAPPPVGIPIGAPVGTQASFSSPAASGIPVPRPAARSTRRGRGRRKSSPWPLVLGMIAVVVVIGVLVVVLNQLSQESARQGVGGAPQSPVVPRPVSPGTRASQGTQTTPPRSTTRQVDRPNPRPIAPFQGVDAVPDFPAMSDGEFDPDSISPLVASPPEGPASPLVVPSRFDDMVAAARRALAERDYPGLRDFSRQVNQEKKANDAEQAAIAEHLDAVRALLDEFANGVRRALTGKRTESEQFEACGHQLVLEPHDEGVTRYSFDGESREFAVARFHDALRGAEAEELAALADIGWRREKSGEPENALDRNYRRIYVAIFLAVDNPESEQREEFLQRAVQLWRESADEGTDHPVLRKELRDAGALAE